MPHFSFFLVSDYPFSYIRAIDCSRPLTHAQRSPKRDLNCFYRETTYLSGKPWFSCNQYKELLRLPVFSTKTIDFVNQLETWNLSPSSVIFTCIFYFFSGCLTRDHAFNFIRPHSFWPTPSNKNMSAFCFFFPFDFENSSTMIRDSNHQYGGFSRNKKALHSVTDMPIGLMNDCLSAQHGHLWPTRRWRNYTAKEVFCAFFYTDNTITRLYYLFVFFLLDQGVCPICVYISNIGTCLPHPIALVTDWEWRDSLGAGT